MNRGGYLNRLFEMIFLAGVYLAKGFYQFFHKYSSYHFITTIFYSSRKAYLHLHLGDPAFNREDMAITRDLLDDADMKYFFGMNVKYVLRSELCGSV